MASRISILERVAPSGPGKVGPISRTTLCTVRSNRDILINNIKNMAIRIWQYQENLFIRRKIKVLYFLLLSFSIFSFSLFFRTSIQLAQLLLVFSEAPSCYHPFLRFRSNQFSNHFFRQIFLHVIFSEPLQDL